jgi:hypothetical protein
VLASCILRLRRGCWWSQCWARSLHLFAVMASRCVQVQSRFDVEKTVSALETVVSDNKSLFEEVTPCALRVTTLCSTR